LCSDKLELADPELLRDAIWLSRFLPSENQTEEPRKIAAPPPGPETSQNLPPPSPPDSPPPSNAPSSPRPARPTASDDLPDNEPQDGRVFPKVLSAEGRVPVSPLQVPAAGSLPQPLELARALRPFQKRFLSRRDRDLDEGATADLAAQSGKYIRLIPVFRPRAERWFSLCLLVDEAPAMVVWRKTARELEHFLANMGIFRDVRSWRFDQELRFRTRSGSESSPQQLNDPSGRTLILVLTNGVGRHWQSQELAHWLTTWARFGPVAVCSLLPKQNWQHTDLGPAYFWARAGTPGATNLSLTVGEGVRHNILEKGVTPFPVFPLTREGLGTWAAMQMSRKETRISALLLADKWFPKLADIPATDEKSKGIERLEADFWSIATPEAVRLLTLFSAIPLVLPIMRLVQHTMMPASPLSAMAEVLMSGLIEPRIGSVSGDPDSVLFDFVKDARAYLRDHIGILDLDRIKQQTQSALTEYIERKAGHSIFDFEAWILDPGGKNALPEELQHFLRVTAELLEALGYKRGDSEGALSQRRLTAAVLTQGFAKLLERLYRHAEKTPEGALYDSLLNNIRGKDENWDTYFTRMLQVQPPTTVSVLPESLRPVSPILREFIWSVAGWLNDDWDQAQEPASPDSLHDELPFLEAAGNGGVISRVVLYCAFHRWPSIGSAEIILRSVIENSEETYHSRALLSWLRCVTRIAPAMKDPSLIEQVRQKIDLIQLSRPPRGDGAETECQALIHSEIRPWIALAQLADDYLSLRKQMPSGSQRTAAMTEVVWKMQKVTGGFLANELPMLLTEVHAGRRLIAYASLEMSPIADLQENVIDSLRIEVHPFGQYRGLCALEVITQKNGMNPALRDKFLALREIVARGEDWDRSRVFNRIAKLLEREQQPAVTPAAAAIAGDPARYLNLLREETSHFDVQGLKFGDNRRYRFSIEEFYIPLTTYSGGGMARHGELRGGTIPLQEALLSHRKLLVVGDPGSGKSTFLKRVAFQLCNEFESGGLLPVRIVAAVFSAYLETGAGRSGPADPASPEWIPLFLGAQSEEKNCGLGADYFRARLQAGGCHVLIDGLDETPDDRTRERLAKLIRAAAAAFDGCRFTVTSRPEGKVPIQGFEEALIGDLEPEAIRAFLAKLAKQLYPEDETRERTFREDLEAAVNGRREIRKMTRNPVMLTALAVLQHNNVKLPEKRVDLYGSILDWLSKQRAKPGRMPASECLLRLRELALEMQNHEEGRRKQAPLAWAGEKLKKRFANREGAERFLRAEQADSGIVVSRGKEIAFWHLTFQEYLAALEIAGWEDAGQYKLLLGESENIYKPEWRETVLLYAGLLYNVGPPKVDALVRNVLDGMGKQPHLAVRAKCVGLIGALLPDLVGYKVADKRYAESLSLVMDIFDAEKWKSVAFKDRLAAAEALGQAGDPRLAKQEWVIIPESRNYWIGAQKKDPKGRNYDEEAYEDETLREVDIAPFRIGKYPVTVGQYETFVEEGTAPNREPANWPEQQDHPNWPVVGVTWHQAVAYGEWAGGRLPTEKEWERAARGPHCTKYPWGDDNIDPSRANYDESKVGHPTPVGLYPSGASAEGALDMVGNVWEWTSSHYSEGSGTYVWRGGCFNYNRRIARSSYRRSLQPVEQNLYLGFRLAGGIT